MGRVNSLAFVLLLGSAACDIDGGFQIESTVSFAGIDDLSYAPIFVQGYAPQDIDANGIANPDATPYYEILASGPMVSEQPVLLTYGSLGYPWEAEFIAWIDVDGDAAMRWQGGGAVAAKPGPGDVIGGPPQLRFVGAQGSYTEFGDPLDFSHTRTIAGELPPGIRITVDSYFSMLDVPTGTQLPLAFEADAYRPEDIDSDEPCETCAPLFTFDETHLISTGARNILSFSSEHAPEPLRLWIRGSAGDTVIVAGVTPALFGDLDAPQTRAARGLNVTMTPPQR